MSEVTAPIMTDATGQSIDSKLNSLLGKMDDLAAAFQPHASGIDYSNTTSGLTGDDVQEAIDEVAGDVTEIKSSLSNKVDKAWTVRRQLAQFNPANTFDLSPFWDEFDELYVAVSNNTGTDNYFIFNIFKEFMGHSFMQGYGISSTNPWCYAKVTINTTTKKLNIEVMYSTSSGIQPNVFIMSR